MAHWRLVKQNCIVAALNERPHYCDRGRFNLIPMTPFWKSDSDSDVRYYFDLERAKLEVEAYLTAKKIDLSDSRWEPDVEPYLEVYRQPGTRLVLQ